MKSVTFIACAYQEKAHDARQFLSSLALQTNENWKCIIAVDGVNDIIKNVLETEYRSFYESGKILLREYPPTAFWGHFNRIYALGLVDTGYVVQTSIQDYYLPITVEYILNKSQNSEFIYWNCLHNHFNYEVLDSKIEQGSIDWGSFAVTTNLARLVKINQPTHHCCDGIFAEECAEYLRTYSDNPAIFKHHKILTVHN